FPPEPGRAHSYLPYSHHPPDLVQSRAALYVEEDTVTLSSVTQVDVINGEHVQQPIINTLHKRQPTLMSTMSFTDRLYTKRQKKSSMWKLCLLLSLVTLATAGILTFFCWPRLPQLELKSEKAERIGEPADWGPDAHPSYRAVWVLNMTLNNHANYIPTHIQDIELTLSDRDTHLAFASATTGAVTLPPHQDTILPLQFRVSYETTNTTDPTFKNLYNACGPQMPRDSPALNASLQAGNRLLIMRAIFHISGLVWASSVVVLPSQLGGFYCPSS
ncbi:hypothetical protein K501DRAFT_170265, partial [Backusella circina FSU 941]